MSFKVSNTAVQESKRRSFAPSVITEYISSSATLTPTIPITVCRLSGTYDVYLPNGPAGQQKVISAVGPDTGSFTVYYNDGYNGGSNDDTFSGVGYTAIYYATSVGWNRYFYND